jgi:ABC-2 type transport system permease protein
VRIFVRELRANLKSLLIWCGIILLLIVLAMAKFSAFVGDPATKEMLNSLPKVMLDMFDMNNFDMATLGGFFGVMFIFFALMGAIAAAMWGSDNISKEERDKTVEFSLVLPVSRNKVITAKVLAALVNCVVLVLFTWIVSLVTARSYSPDASFLRFLTLEMVSMFIIEMIFLAIGLMLGCTMKNYRLPGPVAGAIILVTYFLSVVIGIQANLDFLKYFTPFKYFDAVQFRSSGHLDVFFLGLSAVIIALCVAISYVVYNKRDLYI